MKGCCRLTWMAPLSNSNCATAPPISFLIALSGMASPPRPTTAASRRHAPPRLRCLRPRPTAIERPLFVEHLHRGLQRGGAAESARRAALGFLRVAAMRRGVGADKEASIPRCDGLAQGKTMPLALGHRQTIE